MKHKWPMQKPQVNSKCPFAKAGNPVTKTATRERQLHVAGSADEVRMEVCARTLSAATRAG